MEKSVSRVFSEEVRRAAADAFGADPGTLELLGEFESYVFAFERHGESRILRITHPSHRSAEQIEAELDWVGHVAERGVRLSRPLRSVYGGWTATVGEGDGTFHVCAFERAPGRPAVESDWTPDFLRRWGAFVGRIHRATHGYVATPGVGRRLRWDEDPYVRVGRSWIPERYKTTLSRWDELFARLASLPEEQGQFGICHTDLHPGNFHLHDGEIHAFDTDDCCYHWFLEDLSSVLYYSRGEAAAGGDPDAFVHWAWPEVWRGYRSEHDLAPEWLDHLELFMQARRIVLYALVQMKFEPGDEIRETWEGNRKKIDRGEPIFGVDLRRLAEDL